MMLRWRLIKLINSEITFDQFIVKMNCETQGVSYKCKDDLLAAGIQPQFFEDLERTGRQLKAIHGVKTIRQIPPDKIANNNSEGFKEIEEFTDMPE